MPKQVTVWEAEDGTTFATEEEALVHEARADLVVRVDSFLSEYRTTENNPLSAKKRSEYHRVLMDYEMEMPGAAMAEEEVKQREATD